METIRIECQGADSAPYDKLIETQGELKTLKRDQYEKLRNRIVADGFSEPILVWKKKGKLQIVNGHQRLRTVKKMVEEENYQAPDLPISYVDAKDENQLRRKVLAMASQFGQFDGQGLHDFLEDSDIDYEELSGAFEFAGLDIGKYLDEFHSDDIPDEDLDLDDEPQTTNPEEPHPENVPTSQVKMVQLFFDTETANKFGDMIEALKAYYGTTNVTDTVLATVQESFDAHSKLDDA